MQIKRITAYQVDLPLKEGCYKWSGGKSVTVFDSTIVAVETDTGQIGWGEVCPLGPFYLAAYAGGHGRSGGGGGGGGKGGGGKGGPGGPGARLQSILADFGPGFYTQVGDTLAAL